MVNKRRVSPENRRAPTNRTLCLFGRARARAVSHEDQEQEAKAVVMSKSMSDRGWWVGLKGGQEGLSLAGHQLVVGGGERVVHGCEFKLSNLVG